MHNSGYDKNCFFWPPRDDIYYVPFTHIIGLTEVPNIVGDMGKTITKSVQNCLNYLTCWIENNKVQLIENIKSLSSLSSVYLLYKNMDI